MPAGLTVALALLAPAPAYGPPAPAPVVIRKPARTAEEACATARASVDTRVILVCAQRPQGYRLNPDVMLAKREIRSGGRPTRPGPGAIRDNSRCVVGPAGCATAGINLIGAALTAAEMGSRIAKGQEIGSMFITDPHPSEYQLYVEAKKTREAAEAERAVKAKARAAAAAPTAPAPRPTDAVPKP